mmetsp:Transcript_6380/g.25877  ORF Transcript_6380/g.25877 Transcript_6380/m.25877 type:complete len:274 (-) Transcript_6380:230-1051(-)
MPCTPRTCGTRPRARSSNRRARASRRRTMRRSKRSSRTTRKNAHQDANLPGSFGAVLKNHFHHAAAACFAAGETDPMHLHARFVTTFFRHVCGDHSLCCGKRDPDGDFPAIKRDGAAYASLVALLKDFRSLKHLGFFTRARESYLVEAPHAAIIEYAPKRIFWPESFQHRVALAVIDRNRDQARLCVREAERRRFDGANCGNNRARARVVKELEAKDHSFRHEILARAVYGDARHYDSTAYDSAAACAPRRMAFRSSRESNVRITVKRQYIFS